MWINAFGNYCKFESLEHAVKSGGFFPIPSTFTATDPKTEQLITISSEDNVELTEQTPKTGESVTKEPNEYAFRYADTVINLIDTPGLLDTSDAGTSTHDADKQHVDNIFKLLSRYQEIHAIFIFIKANVTRLSEAFRYTLTEIFKRLDKSACNNVIFIFTNAASTNFKKEKTQSILQRFLEERKLSIALPPVTPTIYCFENSTVQHIAECKQNISHDEDDEEDAQRSWKRSVKSTQDLLGYLCKLEPHCLAAIVSINNATNTVSMMSKVVLDTVMCIFKDMNVMEKKKDQIKELKEIITRAAATPVNLEKLKGLLHITMTKLIYKPLDHSNVVCESPRCATVEEGLVVHRQVCCTACKCRFMYFCQNIGWLGSCRVCGCSIRVHRWKTVDTEIGNEAVYMPDFDHTLDNNEKLKQIDEGISRFENRVKECKDETQQMIEICAKLNAFATMNASLEASCTEDELLKCLENQWQTYAKSPKTSSEADYLEKVKSQYVQRLAEAKVHRYTEEDVPTLIQQLCNLPMKGPEIKQAVDEDEKSRRKVIEQGIKSKKDIIIACVSGMLAGYFEKGSIMRWRK